MGKVLSWSVNNKKLAGLKTHKTIGFSIPAHQNFTDSAGAVQNTCPRAGACAGVCYAKQGFFLMPNVRDAMVNNLELVQSPQFVAVATYDLEKYKRLGYKVVRVHTSGDFFSQSYLEAWYEIARAHPDLLFYAYTKQFAKLDLWTTKPGNFRITQSVGGKDDSKIDLTKSHARIFASHYARRKAGYGNGTDSDLLVIRGTTKVGLVYHGNRNLTASQKKYFK